jgi:hypothetical protein
VATYGDPNVVGYAQPPPPAPIKPYIVPVAAGAAGARLLYTGARPNVAGRIKAADSRVADLDRKLANEAKYKTPRRAVAENLTRQRERAVNSAKIVRERAPLRATKRIRATRAGAGATLVGLAALAVPKHKKPVIAPPVPVVAAKAHEQPKRGRLRRRRAFRRGGGASLIDWAGAKPQATIDNRVARTGLSVHQHQAVADKDYTWMATQASDATERTRRNMKGSLTVKRKAPPKPGKPAPPPDKSGWVMDDRVPGLVDRGWKQ